MRLRMIMIMKKGEHILVILMYTCFATLSLNLFV